MFPVRNVFLCLWVNVLLRQTKVNDVDGVLLRSTSSAYQEVLRLHVTIYQVFAVNIFYSGDLWTEGDHFNTPPRRHRRTQSEGKGGDRK